MAKKLVVRVAYNIGLDMHDPLIQKWNLFMKMEPLALGYSFTHEPDADEVEMAWDKMYADLKNNLLERLRPLS